MNNEDYRMMLKFIFSWINETIDTYRGADEDYVEDKLKELLEIIGERK